MGSSYGKSTVAQRIEKEARWTKLKKIETDCNCGF